MGYTGFSPLTLELPYKEFIYEAAVRAYEDAGVNPHRDIQSDGPR
jgi:acetyl-CoA C-acetyltransferase